MTTAYPKMFLRTSRMAILCAVRDGANEATMHHGSVGEAEGFQAAMLGGA